ncbi:hypothetical protein BDQ17DRAFT_1232093, partial [Cyathus striatus]
SSNQIAFLAIIAHYVTNDGVLVELLIDFQELIGPHSGENLAEAVWNTMELYGIQKSVCVHFCFTHCITYKMTTY